MSRSMSILLGITLAILAVGFAGVAWFSMGLEQMRAATLVLPILCLFCLAGAMACLVPASRPVTLRVVGGAVFLACLGYLIAMALGGPLWSGTRSTPSLVKAFAAFSAFGMPGGYVALKGEFPRWGKYHRAFRS